jgi:hypothetical protein
MQLAGIRPLSGWLDRKTTVGHSQPALLFQGKGDTVELRQHERIPKALPELVNALEAVVSHDGPDYDRKYQPVLTWLKEHCPGASGLDGYIKYRVYQLLAQDANLRQNKQFESWASQAADTYLSGIEEEVQKFRLDKLQWLAPLIDKLDDLSQRLG